MKTNIESLKKEIAETFNTQSFVKGMPKGYRLVVDYNPKTSEVKFYLLKEKSL